jgi:hypothetical protein
MKRKENAPRGGVGECVVLYRSIYEDRLAKRHGIESRVYSEYTSTTSSRGLEEKV